MRRQARRIDLRTTQGLLQEGEYQVYPTTTTIFTKLVCILAVLKTMNARLDFHVQQLPPLPTTTSASPPMPALKLVEGKASLVADPTLQVVKTTATNPTPQPAPWPRHWPPVEISASGHTVVAVLGSTDPSAGSTTLCGPKA
jgi:hypothetical protein